MKSRPFDRSEHVYKNDAFAELVKDAVRFFNGTPVHTLPPPESFLGTGVYAIYYTGKNPIYKKYAELNRLSYSYPIYVGKAVPKGWRQARVSDNQLEQSKELIGRLREHSRNIKIAQGLNLQDFMCRFVIFEDAIYPKKRPELVVTKDKKSIPLVMKDNQGVEHEYSLDISGWIGTYKTTRGRKAEMTDFPDNFISLFANKKMGEFNILPVVGQNKLNEVYVVGQIHVDLFELSELPDMALSNRQGYKSDDLRYVAVLDYVRKELLADILKKREIFTDLGKAKKKIQQQDEQKGNEERLRRGVDAFRKKASEEAANSLLGLGSGLSRETIEEAISKSINDNSPDMGLKSVIDSQKKKILISQTYPDKPFSDIIYQMLLHNNVPAEDILYTNCDDEICRVPEGRGVYDYLREFFVESYSTQKIFVLFVTSENTKVSWGAITEVGASWITQIDHKIFNIHPFRPEHPLNDEIQWQSTNREKPTTGDIWMIPLNADVFCQKIEAVCDALGYEKKTRAVNRTYLGTLVPIRNS